MDYTTHYNRLMQKAQEQVIEDGEVHHIVPKCLGGSNKKANLVKLTYRQHFIAHLLLHKMYPDNHKLLLAHFLMTSHQRYGSRAYETSRAKWAKVMSDRVVSAETRKKLSDYRKTQPSCFKGKTHTEQSKELLRAARKGKSLSQATKDKIGEKSSKQIGPNRGKTFSQEVRDKMSASHFAYRADLRRQDLLAQSYLINFQA